MGCSLVYPLEGYNTAPRCDDGPGVAPCGPGCTSCVVANGAGECSQAACRVASCAPGFRDVDGDAANGCETDTQTSVAHCGETDIACTFVGAAATCEGGQCVQGACATGRLDCAPALPGCEVDAKTDSAHCGSCEKSCAGSPCADGVCRPQALFLGNGAPLHGLALVDDVAYVLGSGLSGGVLAIRKEGDGPPSVVASAQVNGESLVASRRCLYWTTQNAVSRAPIVGKDPGCVGLQLVATGELRPWGVGVAGNQAYWTNFVPGSGTVMSQALDGAATKTAVATEGFANGALALVARDDGVLWLNRGSTDDDCATVTADGSIAHLALPGTTAATVATGLAHPWSLAEGGDEAFVTTLCSPTAAGGTLLRLQRSAANTWQIAGPPVASGLPKPRGVALNATDVFFATAGKGDVPSAIHRASRSNPAATLRTVVADVGQPYAIAADATHVYWTTEAGQLYRFALAAAP